MGDLDLAKTLIQKAINFNKKSQKYRDAYQKMSDFARKESDASRAMNSGDTDEALKLYKEMIAENPHFVKAYYLTGVTLLNKDKVSEGAEYLKKSIELEPDNEQYQKRYNSFVQKFLYEGNQLYRRKNLSGAKEKFMSAIALDAEQYQGLFLIARIYLIERNYNKALEYINKSIAVVPNYPNSYLIKGDAYVKLNKIPEAIDTYNEAGKLDPQNAKIWSKLGLIYYNTKRYDEAIPAYKKVVIYDPSKTSAYVNLGAIYNIKENYEESVKFLSKATDLDPRNDVAWYRLAVAYNKINESAKAKDAASSALNIKPDWGAALLELGHAERRLGNKSAAEQAFKRAARDPKWRQTAEFELESLK